MQLLTFSNLLFKTDNFIEVGSTCRKKFNDDLIKGQGICFGIKIKYKDIKYLLETDKLYENIEDIYKYQAELIRDVFKNRFEDISTTA